MDYLLKYRNREVSHGDFFHVLSEANARGGVLAITPSKRAWRYSRMMIDLAEDYEIISAGEE